MQTGGVWLVGLSFVGVFCSGFFLGGLLLLRWLICFGLVFSCRTKGNYKCASQVWSRSCLGAEPAAGGWARHAQTTCSAFHPTLINSTHYPFCSWHHTVLTSPLLLQSNKSCCVKYRDGWKRELQSVTKLWRCAASWKPQDINPGLALGRLAPRDSLFYGLSITEGTNRPVCYQSCFWQISMNSFALPRSK